MALFAALAGGLAKKGVQKAMEGGKKGQGQEQQEQQQGGGLEKIVKPLMSMIGGK